jgi:hypothetical protein
VPGYSLGLYLRSLTNFTDCPGWGLLSCKILTISVANISRCIQPETQREATQHNCLPRFLGDGDLKSEKVYALRKIIFCTGLTRAAKAGQKSILPARRAQRINQGRIPFICPPFFSVSTVSRGHPSCDLSVYN